MRGFASIGAFRNCDGVSGAGAPSRRNRLLSSYLMNMPKGAKEVRAMIVEDIHCLRDLGAHRQASDLDAVLECFMSRYPEAGVMTHRV